MTPPAVRLGPLTLSAGQPLRVAVYAVIAKAIRSGAYGLGELLPSDAEFSADLKVSRTVIREALLLLEEDHLIRTRRGVGRFVAAEIPRLGLEQLRPMEALLASGSSDATVERVQADLQNANEFIASGLGLDEENPVWAWESVIRRDGAPVCLSVEIIPAKRDLEDASPELARAFADADGDGRTMLAVIADVLGADLGPAICEIGVGTAVDVRARHLDVPDGSPVIVLSQTVSHRGRPLYLGKHALVPESSNLVVSQSVPL